MQSPTRRSAGPRRTPLRLLAVALLLAFGLWHGWQCADGMAATHATQSAQGDHGAPDDDSGTLAGICLSVLITIAGTLLLVTPGRAAALWRSIIQRLLVPAPSLIPSLSLAQLGILRT